MVGFEELSGLTISSLSDLSMLLLVSTSVSGIGTFEATLSLDSVEGGLTSTTVGDVGSSSGFWTSTGVTSGVFCVASGFELASFSFFTADKAEDTGGKPAPFSPNNFGGKPAPFSPNNFWGKTAPFSPK